MTAYKVPADTSKAITIGGGAVTVSNSTPGQNMLATFSTTTASKKVTLTMSSVTGLTSGTVSFIDSNGTVYGGAQGWGISGGSFNATLGAAGSYKILVDPAGGGVGVSICSWQTARSPLHPRHRRRAWRLSDLRRHRHSNSSA